MAQGATSHCAPKRGRGELMRVKPRKVPTLKLGHGVGLLPLRVGYPYGSPHSVQLG